MVAPMGAMLLRDASRSCLQNDRRMPIARDRDSEARALFRTVLMILKEGHSLNFDPAPRPHYTHINLTYPNTK